MAAPANWTTVPVHGQYIFPDGTFATGTVTFTNSLYLRDADLNYVIVPKPVQFILNGTGEFSGSLQATDDPDIDSAFYYTVTEVIGGITTTFPLFVPKDTVGTLELADVDRNITIPPEPEVYVRTINGSYGDVYIPDDLGRVPTSRIIATGTGLTGGGNLTADRTLSVVADTTVQKAEYAKAAALIGTRKRVNFIDGANMAVGVVDNSGQNRVDVTVAATGVMVNTNGIGSITAGLYAARPAAGTAGRMYYATDLTTMYYDDGVEWDMLDQSPAVPKSWIAAGHSYLQFNASSYNQRSRLDSLVRNRWGAEPTNWINLALAASRLTYEGATQGGWATFLREIKKLPGKTAPYTASDGGLLIISGINDLGNGGGPGATAQMQTAFGHALRTVISRHRLSTWKGANDASIAYTGTWINDTGMQDRAADGTIRYTAATTNATFFTITLPADYDGSVVAVQLIGRGGANGGVLTIGGTAMAGKALNATTVTTNNIMPSATAQNTGVVVRITDLTSANASQTITFAVASNAGLIYMNGWGIEAKEAPPVIVANIARLPGTGYSVNYSAWNAAPATGSCDNDVAAFNTVITNVKNEFDGMVVIADMDAALAKNSANFNADNLHPNEIGAALIADAVDLARRRLTLTGRKSAALNMNMAPRYAGGSRMRRRAGGTSWITGNYSAVTTYTPVVGDMFALPFEVTEMDEQYARWALEVTAATSGTCTIRWGMFADYTNTGYPDLNLQELTVGGAFSVSTTVNAQLNPAAQFTWWPDVGLYYLVMKIETIGVGFTFAGLQGPSIHMPGAASDGRIRATGSPVVGAGVAWKLTGQATGAFPTTFPTTAVAANVAPYMGALRT